MQNSNKWILASVFAVSVIGCGFLFQSNATGAQPLTLVKFDYPGAVSTAIWGTNNRGDVVGQYEQPANFVHGFVYRDGKFRSVDGPQAAFTQIRSINDAGDIVGTFISYKDAIGGAPGGGFQGLYQKSGGDLKVMNIPDHLNTIFNRITSAGLVYGCYHDEGEDNTPQDSMHGIVGRIDKFPKFSFMESGTTMHVGGDEVADKYAGMWYDYTVKRHRGYIFTGKKRANFDMPGSNVTIPWDMNDSGWVVGVWGDQTNHPDPEATSAGNYHGFLRDKKGFYMSIDFPASVDTKALGINDFGDVVGSYVDGLGVGHGFIARQGYKTAELRMDNGVPSFERQFSLAGFVAPANSFPGAQVVMMKRISNDTPLLEAKAAPACHHTTAK